jgi:hypothetical protein
VFQKSRQPPLPVLRRKIADGFAAVGKSELSWEGRPPLRKVEARFFSRGWTLSVRARRAPLPRVGHIAKHWEVIGCCRERGGIWVEATRIAQALIIRGESE